jgi:hypothetical protein
VHFEQAILRRLDRSIEALLRAVEGYEMAEIDNRLGALQEVVDQIGADMDTATSEVTRSLGDLGQSLLEQGPLTVDQATHFDNILAGLKKIDEATQALSDAVMKADPPPPAPTEAPSVDQAPAEATATSDVAAPADVTESPEPSTTQAPDFPAVI